MDDMKGTTKHSGYERRQYPTPLRRWLHTHITWSFDNNDNIIPAIKVKTQTDIFISKIGRLMPFNRK